jgi:phospholipid/cholesterol/gamma-HCH transport system permease protein
MADFMGVVGGYFYSVIILEIDKQYYWTNSSDSVDVLDIVIGVVKSLFFGCAIAIISCYRGFRSSAGAEGVGNAATVAFVHSFLAIIVLDFLVALTMDLFYHWFIPNG